MHPLKGCVPAIYSARLRLTHAKTALATILQPQKQFSEFQSVSPNPHSRCRRTEPPLPLPAWVRPVTSLPSGSGVSLVGVLISKYLFIHPIRNLVQANTEVLGICKQQLREARVSLQNVA